MKKARLKMTEKQLRKLASQYLMDLLNRKALECRIIEPASFNHRNEIEEAYLAGAGEILERLNKALAVGVPISDICMSLDRIDKIDYPANHIKINKIIIDNCKIETYNDTTLEIYREELMKKFNSKNVLFNDENLSSLQNKHNKND